MPSLPDIAQPDAAELAAKAASEAARARMRRRLTPIRTHSSSSCCVWGHDADSRTSRLRMVRAFAGAGRRHCAGQRGAGSDRPDAALAGACRRGGGQGPFSADDLAYLRDAWDFRNLLLVERPNGDFGNTLMRHFLFDVYHLELLKALTIRRRSGWPRSPPRRSRKWPTMSNAHRIWSCGWATAPMKATGGCRRRSTRCGPMSARCSLRRKVDQAVAAAGIAPDAGQSAPRIGTRPSGASWRGYADRARRSFRAQGRQAGHPHRASGLHSGRDAVPAARLSRRELVGRGAMQATRSPARIEVWNWLARFRTPRSRSSR
jgi:hypothetical protein